MFVIKRDGRKELVHFDKITSRINKLLIEANIDSIDPVEITQKICSRIYKGITTTELDNLASQICMSMITVHPNFGKLAARIVISNHQKNTEERLIDVAKTLYNNKDVCGDHAPLISDSFLKIVSEHENLLQSMIDFNRDYSFDYFGFKTLERSYLLKINIENTTNKKDHQTRRIVERPQHLYMRVAIGIHGDDLHLVKKTYDALSMKLYTHATPTLFNAGCPRFQGSSCFLMGTEDSIEGIFKSITDCAKISKWSGGIGIHVSNIRARGSYIRKTGGISDGIMPMLKVYNDTARYINQSGKRNGSFAIYLEPWHADVFTFLNVRKNIGDENERARDLFIALWIPDLFMERVEKNENWSLFCPDKCPGLPDVYGDAFRQLYTKYENEQKYNKQVPARELWEAIITSQVETGLPYMSYKDAVNEKNNQKNIDTIRSSNLCVEINQVSNKEETSVCNLASICLPSFVESLTIDGEMNPEFMKNSPEILRKTIEKIVNASSIYVYTTKDCSYCKLLKELLISNDLTFIEIDRNQFEELTLLSGRESKNLTTVPQMFIQDDDSVKHIGGYDDCWLFLQPRINYKKLVDVAGDLIVNLNKIIDSNFYPIEESRVSNFRHRPVGLGVQGLADLFFLLKIPFDSTEAREINKTIFESIYYGAMKSSHELAKHDGIYSTFRGSPLSEGKFQFDLWGIKEFSGMYNWNDLRNSIVEKGVRNSLLIALMPTASTSQICGFNECIEPITSNVYTRRTLAGEFTVINKYLVKDLITLDLWTDSIKEELLYYKGSVQNIDGLPQFLKNVYRTVWEIPQKSIIAMSAERGPFVCQSQSLNLFFEKPDFKSLTAAHFYGWKSGLKTGSYYIRSKAATGGQTFGISVETEKRLKNKSLSVVVDDEGCMNCSA